MHPFTDSPRRSVTALGELRLIEQIRTWLGDTSPRSPFGIGDDCAVLRRSKSHQLITVDPVIYGEHFDDRVSPGAAGQKLFKRNLSDIAAMGGSPLGAVVALALDARVKLQWLASFYRGLAAVSRRFHVPIVGGDIAHHRGGIVATLTLLGETTGPRFVTRQGARTGDWIYVTGRLGGSLQGHHWRFVPRLAEGRWLARQKEVVSMMDVSDGLAKDLNSLTPPQCRPFLDETRIPISAAARIMARRSGRTPLAHALTDGEDYELVFVVKADARRVLFERRWRRAFPRVPLSCIGRFATDGKAVDPRALGFSPLELGRYRGFEHLQASHATEARGE